MKLCKLVAFLLVGLSLSACRSAAPAAPSGSPTHTPSPLPSRTPPPTHTATLSPSATPSPSPTLTVAPSPTFAPTPTPTLLGGYAGNYLTVEVLHQRLQVVLWNEAGEKIRALWTSPADLSAYGYVRTRWSPRGDMISIEYMQAGGHLVLLSPYRQGVTHIVTGINFYGGAHGQANWSPDGRWLVFAGKGENDYVDIYRIDADGSNLLQLTNTYAEEHGPFFHPDGSRIIFRDQNDSLWTMGVDGSDPRLLLQGPVIIMDWSPDLKRVLLSMPQPADLLIMEIETLALTRLTSDGIETYESDEQFSPDGQWILYMTLHLVSPGNNVPRRGRNLYIMPVDMSQEPLFLATVEEARFSPDGSLIYYYGWKEGEDVTLATPHYYRMRLDGRALARMGEDARGRVFGVWSPGAQAPAQGLP